MLTPGRRKSFFQSLRSKKDQDKERKRASSFGATSPPHLDTTGAPPVPPLPSGTSPIAAQFTSPPTRLDPAPRGKRLSLIPRKAPPSAWAGASTADDSGVPTGGVSAPAPVAPQPQAGQAPPPPSSATKPLDKRASKTPLGAIQLDDLDSSLALAPELSALDALDRLDAIGADLDLAPLKTPGGRPGAPVGLGSSVNAPPPSAFSSTSSKRASLPAFDKPLPTPTGASSLAPKPGASKHLSLAPRKAGEAPQIDSVAAIKPSVGKMMQSELPPPPGVESSVRSTEPSSASTDSAVRSAPEPKAGSKKKDDGKDNKGAQDVQDAQQDSSSSGADASTSASTQAGYRLPPPAGVETAPLPDLLNRPSAGYDPTGVSKTGNKLTERAADTEEAPRVMGGPRKIQAVEAAADQREDVDAVPQSDRPPLMGGPGKIQAVYDSSQETRADDTPRARDELERPPLMGGPAKIQAVYDSSREAQEGDQSKEDSRENAEDNSKDESEEKKVEETKAAAGETEEMVDDAASDTASEVQPISTDLHNRPLSTSTWASTERLVDDDPRHSSFSDRDRASVLTDFGSPRRLSTDTGHGLLGTPSRSRLPSTQTFGNLPGTTTFGALPRPASLVSPAVGAVEEGDEDEEGGLAAVAEGETAQADARARAVAHDVEGVPETSNDQTRANGGPEERSTPSIATTAPTTPPRIPTALPQTPHTPVPELCTPDDGTPPSQHITTPAPSAPSLASTPAHPSTSPFKATRSVSTPSKPPLSPYSPGGEKRLARPHSPADKEVARIPSLGSLRPVGRRSVSTPIKDERESEEPTLDDFMTLFRQVQGRGKGVSIRAAAAAAEGKEVRGRGVGVAQ